MNHFSSPLAAQIWFEWRSKGWTLPLFVATGIAVSVIVWAFRSRDLDELYKGFLACGFLLPCLGGLLGAFALGNFGFSWTKSNQEDDFEMGHFLASRPLTSTTIAYANLVSLGKSVLISWSLWAIPLCVLYKLSQNSGMSAAANVGWWYLPLTLLLLWTPTAVSASGGLTGEMRRVAYWLMVVMVAFVAVLLLSNGFLTFESRVQLFHLALSASGIVAVAGTFWLFNLAYDRQLINTLTATHCGWIWIVLTAAIVFERLRNPSWSTSVILLMVGVAALAVVPLAAAPLAIGRNRTR